MVAKNTSKRQVAFPKRDLDALGVGRGNEPVVKQGLDGVTLRPRRFNYSLLGVLRSKIPPGHPPFNIESFRNQAYDPAFRD